MASEKVPFNWTSFIGNAIAAVVIATVVGTLCFHFLADEDWKEAFGSSLPFAGLALLGVAIGLAVAHMVKSAKANSAH